VLQIELSQPLLNVLDVLEPGSEPKQQVVRLVEQELRRRLARYQLSDRLFQAKYGMTLEEFEAAKVVTTHGYAFDVENDHQDWDLAVDGVRTVDRQLATLRGEA
jgi:hypothetical protein